MGWEEMEKGLGEDVTGERRGKGGEKRGRDVGVGTERGEEKGRERDRGEVGWRRKDGEEGNEGVVQHH